MPGVSVGQIRVVDFEPHLFMECTDYEFPNRDPAALCEEGSHPEIGIDALDPGSIHGAGRRGRNRAIVDSLAAQRQGHRMATLLRHGDGLLTNASQIASDFIGQHLLQS